MMIDARKTEVLKRCTIDQVEHPFRRYARRDAAGPHLVQQLLQIG